MNELTKEYVFSQEDVLAAEQFIADNLPPVELVIDEYFASGVYARNMKAPAGTVISGKAHRNDHICVLLKGVLKVTDDNGVAKYMRAPAIWVAKGGQKKLGFVIEDLEFVNFHASQSTDSAEIEKEVIIPEEEYRLIVAERNKELKMNNNLLEVFQ